MFNKLGQSLVFQTGNGTRYIASAWVGSRKLGHIQGPVTVATCRSFELGHDIYLFLSLDIALDLVQCYPLLAIAEDIDRDTTLHIMAQKPSTFPSGTQFALWQRWIYRCW